jgi:branched-chain amino acid transport system substrate-binding protein
MSAAQELLTRDRVHILVSELVNSSVTLAIQELAPSYKNVFFIGEGIALEAGLKIKENPEKYRNFWKWVWASDGYSLSVASALKILADKNKIPGLAKKVMFIVEDTAYGRSNVIFMRPLLEKDAWTIVSVETIPLGYTDFYPQLLKLRSLAPDVLISFTTSIASGIALAKQLKEQNVKALFVGVPFAPSPDFMKGAGEAANSTVACPYEFDPVNIPKHKEFKQMLGLRFPPKEKDDVYREHALGWSCADVMYEAIRRAGTLG